MIAQKSKFICDYDIYLGLYYCICGYFYIMFPYIAPRVR
jgi:hypothetical protein